MLLAWLWLVVVFAEPAQVGDAVAGAQVAAVAGCASCHTSKGGEPYAGGYALKTDFGTFYGSNLTTDPTSGLGRWTYADFDRAMRRGKSPDGHAYWPAFPYTSFTRMSQRDLRDLWAFLQTLPAIDAPNRPHDADRPRWQLGAWRSLAFTRRGPAIGTPDPSMSHDRGEYLVDAVGHCAECHSPRSRIGRIRWKRGLSGNPSPPEPAPDIRSETLGWTADEWRSFLQLGMLPDGDFVGGEMSRIIAEGTATLPESDRVAMAVFLSGSAN